MNTKPLNDSGSVTSCVKKLPTSANCRDVTLIKKNLLLETAYPCNLIFPQESETRKKGKKIRKKKMMPVMR